MQFFRQQLKTIYPAILLLLAILFITPLSLNAADKKKKFVVVIDAGHGGSDHGAIENGVTEKDVNLAVALKLGALIEKKLKDTEVIYTRKEDNFISLQKRADVANSAKADLFVSIHCNSVDRSNKNRANVLGATTYVLGHHKDADNLAVARRENAVVELDADDSAHYSNFDPSSDESHIIFQMTQKKNFQNSIRFAADVQREMESIGRVSRGVQQAGFWVLWSTAAPAALIELDFICNPEQAKFLAGKEGQDKMAGAIFNAVKNYENYYRMSLGMASNQSAKAAKETNEAAPAPAERPEVEVQQAVAPVEMAELPAASGDTEVRRRATAVSSTQKKNSDGRHRRRSSAARNVGASQIEEVMIAVSEEVVPETTEVAAAPAASTKPLAKSSSKSSSKSSASPAAPGRRDRDKKTGRKGVKQSVNIDYRVLLFVSDDELLANDEAFQGLTPVATFRENNKFKYTYGESADRKEMEGLLKEISALFPDARVIKCYY